MCPACIATAAWIAAGVASTGGIFALVVGSFRGKNQDSITNKKNLEEGEKNGEKERD
jgi:hypothetical protein